MLFHIRAINYIINGDSLIHIFIDELIRIISNIDKQYLGLLENISFIVCDKNDNNNSLNSSKVLNNQNENAEKEKEKIINQSIQNVNLDIFKNVKNKSKIKLKLKVDKNKNKKIIKENIYDNKEIYYKFPGLPISGYQGHIPKKDYFSGISNSKIIKNVFDKGFYLSPYIKEKEYIIDKNNILKKNVSKIIIDCEGRPLTKKDQNYKIIKKYNNSTSLYNQRNKFNFSFDCNFIDKNKKRGKKNIHKILEHPEFREFKRLILGKEMEKIIKHDFYKINNNLNALSYDKRHNQNKSDQLINVFDCLFSIKKVGLKIEVIQNDISDLLQPYLEEEKFKELINQVFQRKKGNELPENWRKLLSLTNLYPAFGLNKLIEDKASDGYLGIVKLHKNY